MSSRISVPEIAERLSIGRLAVYTGCTKNKRYQGDTTMREGNEDNKPHLCVPTLDGNAHVIPTEVFYKIISGEMKITDMDDWEIITRTAFSEWLRGLETAAKMRKKRERERSREAAE